MATQTKTRVFGTTDIISSMNYIPVTGASAWFHLFKATRVQLGDEAVLHAFTGCTVVTPGTTALFASTLHELILSHLITSLKKKSKRKKAIKDIFDEMSE